MNRASVVLNRCFGLVVLAFVQSGIARFADRKQLFRGQPTLKCGQFEIACCQRLAHDRGRGCHWAIDSARGLWDASWDSLRFKWNKMTMVRGKQNQVKDTRKRVL